MDKHLLLTVGDDLNSLYGVRFAGSFFTAKQALSLTMLYVAPRFETMDRREDQQFHQMDRKLAAVYLEKGKAAIQASVKHLAARGFQEKKIHSLVFTKRYGTVQDIILEGRKGNYDAVVLGRRGFALFEKAFYTSVSRAVLERDVSFPLWICRRPEEGRRNVLLCVDESEASLRIADHVGFMLEEEEHSVTLFHVDDGEGKDAAAVIEPARQALLANGMPEARILTRVAHKPNVVKAILEEVEQGGYAAVAVGKGGVRPKSRFKNWMIGSRSTNLLELLEKAALWVSR
jgi:nucleotide-binding universal stress UspA family protein